jgi:GTP-binding protein LepA
MKQIRNFCIIAHIDHGKSTLADRLLEVTNTVEKREMKAQLLDQMDLERERGITIKLQPVTMDYTDSEGNEYILNLIDTPGHVDFTYEVSRSLAAVEGAVLLVDATQGIQAQTLANLYLALDQDLVIIPVANKVDLPSSDIDSTTHAIHQLLGSEDEVSPASGKTGEGVPSILERVVKEIPAPDKAKIEGLRALIFDSIFDDYRGAIAYVRIMDGQIKKGDKVKFSATGREIPVLEVGVFKPHQVAKDSLSVGEIGYIVTGLKEVSDVRVGDTISGLQVNEPLEGYKEMKPMVFAGIFCQSGDDYPRLRDAMDRLKLSDAALTYEVENSPALGFGFRCGFLGMLHLEIIQERLKREFDLDLVITVPSVAYKISTSDGEEQIIKSPQELPDSNRLNSVLEPIMKIDVVTPSEYVGSLMQLIQERRGEYLNTEYIDDSRAILHYKLPLSVMLVDFYDKLKSVSSGYASLNYDFDSYQSTEIVKLDILIAEEKEEALSSIVYKNEAAIEGKKVVAKLKEVLTKQQFVLKIQAAVGAKVVAAERLSALRKDVTAKLYGGDVTRKRKLLEKQKKGKKKMAAMGHGKVKISSDAYRAVLKR